MRLVSTMLAVLALALLSPLAVLAQPPPPPPAVSVPRLINISGVFQPADGQPPAPVEVVTLSIYADQDGGLPLWQEMQTVALDKAGRFTVLLGATHPDGLPREVFASGEARWMSMLFARTGEAERPRVRITSVPYALKASDAETLGGLPASAYLLAPAAEEERGRAADAKSKAEAAVGEPVAADLVLAGTTNVLAKYVSGAAGTLGNSAVFENGGQVGLGTATPLDRFHVRFTNTNGGLTGLAVQNLGNTNLSYSGMLFYDHTGAVAQFQGFNNGTHEYRINNIASNASINFMTGSTSRFVVASSGNVGIGTAAPTAALEVSNAVTGAGTGTIIGSTYTANSLSSLFVGQKARGTAAAPTAVQGGDQLAFFGGRGYGTNGFGSFSGMTVFAAETWTGASQGSMLHFKTTPWGAVVPVTRMALLQGGNLLIGTYLPPGPEAAVEVVREGDTSDFRATAFGGVNAGESTFFTRTARGTFIAPTAVELGDELGTFGATGYGTTAFGEFAAGMGTFAGENWTDTAHGAGLYFAATPLLSNEAQAYVGILPSGNVGIGVFNDIPVITDKLQVFGDIRVGTAGTNGCLRNFAGTGIVGSCVSDRRYKKDITPFGPVLGQLTALQPVHYFWRAADFPSQNFGESRAYGLIAQDAEQVLPELVVTGADGFKAVDYSKLPLLTIQAVKELKSENDALKHRVAELERMFAEMVASAARR